MSAATQDRVNFAYKDCHTSGFAMTPYTSTTIYDGTLVMNKTAHAGYAEPATHSAAGYFVGVCIRPNSTTATASDDVVIVNKGQILFNIASATTADIGKIAYILDDQTVQTSTTNLLYTMTCGTVVAVPSSTTVVVDIADRYTRASLS